MTLDWFLNFFFLISDYYFLFLKSLINLFLFLWNDIILFVKNSEFLYAVISVSMALLILGSYEAVLFILCFYRRYQMAGHWTSSLKLLLEN